MTEQAPDPQQRDEWRVEVSLEEGGEEGHTSLGERLHALNIDNEARERLGGSVIVTRDGQRLYLYAWHEQSAREAERAVRELMESEGLAGEVELKRWHPAAEDWRPAEEPLPESNRELDAEEWHQEQQRVEAGEHPWEVVIDMPGLRSTRELADELIRRGFPVKRRFRYVLVGCPTEEAAIELGQSFEGKVPKGCHVGIRANPDDLPYPVFVMLGSLKPGVMRDLGI